jgi:hypothetical protein
MKTIPSETGSAIVSSAAATPVPIATTTIAPSTPSHIDGAFALRPSADTYGIYALWATGVGLIQPLRAGNEDGIVALVGH